VRQALKWLGFFLEESRKLLNKANPKKRLAISKSSKLNESGTRPRPFAGVH
jgi:hypothetical protein